ncbi:putative HTH-type transcriptional regulator [Anaerolineae bacterium]|nr:putative HTH-type transcriptional regulator [Anaerolineae bacterium]
MPKVRQDALRGAAIQAIKDTARHLMAEQGTAGLSVRGIAKALHLTPPALYTYFTSLDDLITALITDNFNALADTLEHARDALPVEDPVAQLEAVMNAYRQWAVDHPVDFQLNYGNPIPGYHAPREITVPAVVRSFVVIVGLIERIVQSERYAPNPPYDTVPPRLQPALQRVITEGGYPVSELALYLSVSGWGEIHGIIMLELFHHIQALVGDTATYYQEQIRRMMRAFGIRPKG